VEGAKEVLASEEVEVEAVAVVVAERVQVAAGVEAEEAESRN